MTEKKEQKSLVHIPRVLTSKSNFDLVKEIRNYAGELAISAIVFVARRTQLNLFSEAYFSIEDFCKEMGYDRTNLERKLSEEEIYNMYGKYSPEIIIEGTDIKHKIETVFEMMLYRLGRESLTLVSSNEKRTGFNYVQIFNYFEIKGDFTTNKGTKRKYLCRLNPQIIKSLQFNYNTIDIKDFQKLPSRVGYKYFYLHLVRMINIVMIKIKNGEVPVFTMTIDELAQIFDVKQKRNDLRKQKIKSILTSINNNLNVTKFNFEFIKGVNQRYAYTVKFDFPVETLNYFQKEYEDVVVKYYNAMIEAYNKKNGFVGHDNYLKFEELKSNPQAYEKFIEWCRSDEDAEEKERIRKNFWNK